MENIKELKRYWRYCEKMQYVSNWNPKGRKQKSLLWRSLIFFSKSWMHLSSIFKPMINFDNRCSELRLIFPCEYPVSLAFLLERVIFLFWLAFILFNICWTFFYGSISLISVMFCWSVLLSISQHHIVLIIVAV